MDVDITDKKIQLHKGPKSFEDVRINDELRVELTIRNKILKKCSYLSLEYGEYVDGEEVGSNRFEDGSKRSFEIDPQVKKAHRLVISKIQLRPNDDEDWTDDLKDASDCESIEARSMEGTRLMTQEQYDEALDSDPSFETQLVAKRFINGWKNQDGSPYVLYAVKGTPEAEYILLDRPEYGEEALNSELVTDDKQDEKGESSTDEAVKPEEASGIESDEASTSEPIEVQKTEPTEASATEPAEVQKTESIEAPATEPAEVQKTDPTKASATEPTEVQKTEPTEAPAHEPMKLSLRLGEKTVIELAQESEKDGSLKLEPVARETIRQEPGDYAIKVEGTAKALYYTFTEKKPVEALMGEDQDIGTQDAPQPLEDGAVLTLEAGKRYTFGIYESDAADSKPAMTFELDGLIVDPAELKILQIDLNKADGDTLKKLYPMDGNADAIINQEDLRDVDEDIVLRVTGEAQPGTTVQVSFALNDETKLSDQEGTVDENGKWAVDMPFSPETLIDVDGSLKVEGQYKRETAELFESPDKASQPAVASVSIDTQGPEFELKIKYNGEEKPVEDGGTLAFVRSEGAQLEVLATVTSDGTPLNALVNMEPESAEGEPLPNSTTGNGEEKDQLPEGELQNGESLRSYDILAKKTGDDEITCTVTDWAGNVSIKKVNVRLVANIGAEASIGNGKVALGTGSWINSDNVADGKTVEVTGSGEPGQIIQWRVDIEQLTDGKKTVNQGEAGVDETGRWEVAFDIPDAVKAGGMLALVARYGDKALDDVVGEFKLGPWHVDIVPPEKPELSLTEEGAKEKPGVLMAGKRATLTVGYDKDATVKLYLNGKDITEEAPENAYTFTVKSGAYAFTAVATDGAGNESEKASLTVQAAGKIALSLVGDDGTGDILNEAFLEKGLSLQTEADQDRKVTYECVTGDGAVLTEQGKVKDGIWTLDMETLKGVGSDGPVTIKLTARYADLGEADALKLGDTWEGDIDLWAPEVEIVSVTSCGSNGYGKSYFDGEDIAIGVKVVGSAVEVSATEGGTKPLGSLGQSLEDFAALNNRNTHWIMDQADGEDVEYRLLEQAHGDGLSIQAAAVDEAGNKSESAVLKLTLITPKTSGNITIKGNKGNREFTVEKVISGGDSSVTIEGSKAIPMYRLVSDGLKTGVQIPVNDSGEWSLSLDRSTLPEGIADGPYTFVLRYPSDYYDKETSCAVTVTVDTACELSIAPIRVGDQRVSVTTDPGASVRLTMDGETLTGVAEQDGSCEIELLTRIRENTELTIEAKDNSGNVASETVRVGGDTGLADHQGIAVKAVSQRDVNTLVVIGTAEPGCNVRLSIDGNEAAQAVTDANGAFTLEADIGAIDTLSVALSLSYADYFTSDAPVEQSYDIDREPPELHVESDTIGELGGELVVNADKAVTIAFSDEKGRPVPVEENGSTYTLPDLANIGELTVTATDAAGNVTSSTVWVEKSPEVLGGILIPEEGAVLDSEGNVNVEGWVASVQDGVSDASLWVTEAENGREYPLKLVSDDGSSRPASGKMRDNYYWKFQLNLPLKDWKKGEVAMRVRYEGRDIGSAQTVTLSVDTGRRNLYIALTVVPALALVACLFVLFNINKRIRRITDGKVDPSSGKTKLTERSQEKRDK